MDSSEYSKCLDYMSQYQQQFKEPLQRYKMTVMPGYQFTTTDGWIVTILRDGDGIIKPPFEGHEEKRFTTCAELKAWMESPYGNP